MFQDRNSISSNLMRLKQEFDREAQKMASEKVGIERLRSEIAAKERELQKLTSDHEMSERKYRDHERQIRQATEDLRKIELGTVKEHSQTKRF